MANTVDSEGTASTSESDETDSTQDSVEHFGITKRQATRRDKLRTKFLKKFPTSDNTTEANTIMKFIQKKYKNPTTALSSLTTLAAELKRRNIAIIGDMPGIKRMFALRATKHQPQRVPPIPKEIIIARIASTKDLEIATMIAMTWTFGARLTSIHKLKRDNISFSQRDHNSAWILATFREGKTILSTGAYSIRGIIPTKFANWTTEQSNTIFKADIEYYYSKIKKAIHPYKIRSIRRSAMQTLAEQHKPESILLLSRHKTIASLYAYLDDGSKATWEHHETEQLMNNLWN